MVRDLVYPSLALETGPTYHTADLASVEDLLPPNPTSQEKWRGPSPNIKVGDCVLVKDETLRREDAPSQRVWPMRLITATFPGPDGLVRAVDVLCNGKTYNRTITCLGKILSHDEPSSPMGTENLNS